MVNRSGRILKHVLMPRGGGGGALDPCLGIGVPLGFEILTLFRTKITLNTYPVKDNALNFKTLFRTEDNIELLCYTSVVITFKGPLSLTGRDVPRIETRIPITTDKIMHFLEVMAKNPKISH